MHSCIIIIVYYIIVCSSNPCSFQVFVGHSFCSHCQDNLCLSVGASVLQRECVPRCGHARQVMSPPNWPSVSSLLNYRHHISPHGRHTLCYTVVPLMRSLCKARPTEVSSSGHERQANATPNPCLCQDIVSSHISYGHCLRLHKFYRTFLSYIIMLQQQYCTPVSPHLVEWHQCTMTFILCQNKIQ